MQGPLEICQPIPTDSRQASSSLPEGRPPPPRRAASSCRSHASCILTGTTQTCGHPLDFEAPISSYRTWGACLSASRWTKQELARILTKRSRQLLGQIVGAPGERARNLPPNLNSSGVTCLINHWSIGTSTTSDVPSVTNVELTIYWRGRVSAGVSGRPGCRRSFRSMTFVPPTRERVVIGADGLQRIQVGQQVSARDRRLVGGTITTPRPRQVTHGQSRRHGSRYRAQRGPPAARRPERTPRPMASAC